MNTYFQKTKVPIAAKLALKVTFFQKSPIDTSEPL